MGELRVYNKSMDLVEEIYNLTVKLPEEEKYGLCSQMRRAVTSIPMNIEEGQARRTDKEFGSFLYIARGSNAEIRTQLAICERLGFLTVEDMSKARLMVEEVGKLLNSLINCLKLD